MYVIKYKVLGKWYIVKQLDAWPCPRLFAYASQAKEFIRSKQPEAEEVKVIKVKLQVKKELSK